MTIDGLKWYYELKEELGKYSIADDISEFARLVNNINQHSGYDANKVINEFWSLEMLRTNYAALENNIASLQRNYATLENHVKNLKEQRSTLEVIVNMHNQTISTYNGLNNMGFALKEFTFLYDTINEIAIENDIPVRNAVSKFLLDVEEQYDKKLGFEHKLQNLRDEINKLRKEQVKLRTEILQNPLLGPKLLKLVQSGLTEQDI